MKVRLLLCSVVLIGILGYGGCKDGNSLTEPDRLDLNGAWTGAITYYDSPACAREGIAVPLSQDGTTVTGSFQTSCQGMLELRGAMNGDSIAGELYGATDGVRIGQISGTASRTSIRITTWGPQAREDDGPRVRALINVIDLTRTR
jgi:hypothetical protein